MAIDSTESQGAAHPNRLPGGTYASVPLWTASACYIVSGNLYISGVVTGTLVNGYTIQGAGITPGVVVGNQIAPNIWALSADQQQILPAQTSFSCVAAPKLLPYNINLPSGTYAYCNDSGVVSYQYWNNLTRLWAPWPGSSAGVVSITSPNGSIVIGGTGSAPTVDLAVQASLTPGTYNSLTVNSRGVVTAASNVSTGVLTLAATADITVAGTATNPTLSLNTQGGVTPGAYNTITINSKGIATAGSNTAYVTSVSSSTLTVGGTATAPTLDTIPTDIQTFAAGGGTWTKPAGVTPNAMTDVYLFGAGGGGGSGALNTATGTALSGGSGGGAGSNAYMRIPTSSLGTTENVTVGAGGTGGAAVATTTGPGNAGSVSGTNTAFGAWLRAFYGGAGFGGVSAASSGGGGAGGVNTNGGNGTNAAGGAGGANGATGAFGASAGGATAGGGGGGGQAAAAGSSGGGGYVNGAGGGGSGAGVSTTASGGGGAGGYAESSRGISPAGGTAGTGTAGLSGTAGATTAAYKGGQGGAGGGSGFNGNGGNGGAGGRGAGGGGGGASAGGTSSGAGASGGDGFAVAVTFPA